MDGEQWSEVTHFSLDLEFRLKYDLRISALVSMWYNFQLEKFGTLGGNLGTDPDFGGRIMYPL